MEELLIQPSFIDSQAPQLLFPAANLNALVSNEYAHTFGFWQSMFSIFSYMKMTRLGKFTLHDIRGTPLVWQPLKGCVSDATGSLRMHKREIFPCAAVLKEKMCWDELLGSLFEHFLSFEGAAIELDANGIKLVNEALRTLMINAQMGARMTLTSGNLYDVDESTVNYNPENTLDHIKLFKATYFTCDGWMKKLIDLATDGELHCNVADFFSGKTDTSGLYNGNFVTDIDALKAAAKKKMLQLINSGGIVAGSGRVFTPVVIVSDDVYSQVVVRYNTESALAAQNQRRLVRESITTGTGTRPNLVYYIDNMPIIPLSEIGGYDAYLAGTTQFIGIVATGNIQLGMNYDLLPGLGGDQIAMIIEYSKRVEDYGMQYYLAHALFANGIVDTDYIVAAQAYTEPTP